MSSTRLTIRESGKHYWATKAVLDQTEDMFRKMLRSDATIEQRFRCIYCRDVLTLKSTTAEHALPRSRGGSTERKNIKGACSPCNAAKANGTDSWFRRVLNGPDFPLNDRGLAAAYIRFRLNRRVERAEKRIRAFMGMPAL